MLQILGVWFPHCFCSLHIVVRSLANTGGGMCHKWMQDGELSSSDYNCIQLCELLPAVAQTLTYLRYARHCFCTYISSGLLHCAVADASVSGNNLSDEAGRALAAVLPKMVRLQALRVQNNTFSTEMQVAIKSALPPSCTEYLEGSRN